MQFECVVCSKGYTSYSGMYVHSKLSCQPSTPTYYCNDCPYSCTSQDNMLRHMNKSHSSQFPVKIRCPRCRDVFSSYARLKKHERVCGVTLYDCKFCPYRPRYIDSYRKHLEEFHSERLVANGGVEGFILDTANQKRNLKGM